jgi:hypothetical protein
LFLCFMAHGMGSSDAMELPAYISATRTIPSQCV